MDKLRAAVAYVTEMAAGSRPMVLWSPASQEDQRGQGLAEYALILALIAIIAIVSLAFLGNNITAMFWAPISEDFGDVLSSLGL